MNGALKLDSRRFEKAMRNFARYSKRDSGTMLTEQARGFTKQAIGLTPPSLGRANTQARQRGESAIAGDLFGGRKVSLDGFQVRTKGVFIVDSDGKFKERDDIVSLFTAKDGRVYGVEKKLYRPNASVEEMLAHRDRFRSKSTGKMSTAGLRTLTNGRHVFIDRMVISPAAKKALLKKVFGAVGTLAGGFNAASERLGVTGVPSWIKRHGSRYGSVEVRLDADRMSIVIINSVPYVGNVRDLERRVQQALDWQARAMERRVDFFLERAAKKAGF